MPPRHKDFFLDGCFLEQILAVPLVAAFHCIRSIMDMDRVSLGFVVLVLVFGLLIGSVLGSLLNQVFGFSWLDYALVPEGFAFIEDFYLIRRLELQITPGAILGFCVAVWYLYRALRKTDKDPA